MALILVLTPAGALCAPAGPLSGRIVVDGLFTDWSDRSRVHEVSAPDPEDRSALIEAVWIHSDRDRLSLRARLSRQVLLQGNSRLVLHIDTDGDPGTGLPVDGLGADFSWHFSEREGRLRVMGVPVRLIQSDVELRQAPVISADEFEISVARRVSVVGAPFLPTPRIALTLREESEGQVIGSTGPLEVDLDPQAPPPPPPVRVPEKDPDQFRTLTYNVLYDGNFERPLPFRRILGALEPDVLCLQEIYRHSVDESLAWIRHILPNTTWHAAGFGQGVILSRFPVLEWGPIGTRRRGAWAILDTPDGKLAVVNPHAPCCQDDAGRQDEFDALTAWIRDSRASGLLDPRTPVIVAGDMNLVGDAQQLTTLLEGAIVDTATHGPAAPPDGDGTPFVDVAPYHLSGTETYTWRSDLGEFAPGKLDYILYTDSVLGLGRSFVLWTPDLDETALREAGLEVEDTRVASDHLPVVADFYFRAATSSR